MKAMIAWWELAGSGHDAASLRTFLRAETRNWEAVDGLLLKMWISDPEHERWGAVLVWESEEAASRAELPRSAAEVIGQPLGLRVWFDVEATVEGNHSLPSLAGHGPP
ncbi:hypothetical protein [Streptomyces parvus]|uniref:hypothetical protein n=1 Tax=Streptomyces parvus TaxID=66428 RepID=UPI00371348C3